MQDGNYLVGIYEDDELISARGIIISNATGSKGIGLMWTTDHQCPTDTLFDSVPSRIQLQKSQKVYVNLFPMVIQGASEGFNPNKRLPELELKNSTSTVVLKPLVRVDRCYGDRATYVYFGEYQIPAEISSGKYEARLIFPEYGHSLPYWNVLNIY